MMIERRGCERFTVHDEVFVQCAQGTGKITDISMTGFLCSCDNQSGCFPASFDIFCPGSNICLDDVPYTIIETKGVENQLKFRKLCRVQFDPLSYQKNLKLQSVIERHTLRN